MGPVGGLVSAQGAKPGDLAGTLGLEAAPFCPKCDPSLSEWSFNQWMNVILQIFLIAKAFFVLSKSLKFQFTQLSKGELKAQYAA